MASTNQPNDRRAQAVAYLQQLQKAYDQARTPQEIGWLLAGCTEYRGRELEFLSDLHAPFDQLIAQLRTDNDGFNRLYANDPFVRDAVADRNAITPKHIRDALTLLPTTEHLQLRPLTVPQLRELVLRCDAQFRAVTWPAKVADFLQDVAQHAQAALAQQLGREDTFLTLEIVYTLAPPPPDPDANAALHGLLYDTGERTATVTLALADYWMLYWLAQRLTPVELDRLSSFGCAPHGDAAVPEAFPADAKQALLRAWQTSTPIADIRTALETFTYDLLRDGLITYQEAAALASEALQMRVNVEAWAKRVSRWADRNKQPRLDGRKIAVDVGVQPNEQRFSWRRQTLHVSATNGTI